MPWARSFWAFSPFLNRMLKFSQLIVENSATSTASFKYFILLLQPLHSATSSALFRHRNCLFHPAKSNPSPNEVVSLTQRSRILQFNETYELAQWRTWSERGSLDDYQDASETTSRRICYCVGTHLLLRRDVANAASGRNFHFLSWLWFLLSPAILQRSGRRNTLRPYSHIPQKDCSILPYLVIIHYTNVHCAFYATQITQ